MTKFRSFHKTERKQLKREKNNKIYFYDNDDLDEKIVIDTTSKSRIPSKQQYKRLKNKCFMYKSAQNLNNYKILKNGNQRTVLKEQDSNSPKKVNARSRHSSEETFNSRPQSACSFHIQPDWSDFEDEENVIFESELDVDLSKVFKLFDNKEIMDIGMLDDLCLPFEMPENTLSSWAGDLSTHRYDHALSTISFIKDMVRSNYTNIFSLEFNVTMWSHYLADANMLVIFCESNRFLFQDLMTREYSVLMQNNCLKWTELATKCALMKSSLEKIVNFNEGKQSLDATLCVLYEQCISIIDHGLVYPDPLVVRIIEGIKKILKNLKFQYNKIKIVLEDLLDLTDECSTIMLEKVNQEIIILEDDKSSNNQLKYLLQSISAYLRKESPWNSEPEMKSCHNKEGVVESFSGIKGTKHHTSLEHFHLKLIFVFLMSMFILFSGPEMDMTSFMNEYSNNHSVHLEESVQSVVLNQSSMNT